MAKSSYQNIICGEPQPQSFTVGLFFVFSSTSMISKLYCMLMT